MVLCNVDDCSRSARTKGLCEMHYARLLRHGDPTIATRVRASRLLDDSCKVSGCAGTLEASGFCNKHYLRFKKFGDPNYGNRNHAPAIERFWRFVEKRGEKDCWIFKSGRADGSGYGHFQPGGKGTNSVVAHRWLYEQINGPIPDGLLVCHHCDNRRCVNPAHLWLGTPKENTQDMIRKGRHARQAPLGTENGKSILTPKDVKFIRRSNEPHTVLARILGVSPNAVRGVRTGRTWSHIK